MHDASLVSHSARPAVELRAPAPRACRTGRLVLLAWALAAVASQVGAPSHAAAQQADDTPLRIAVVDIEEVAARSSAGQQLQTRMQEFQQEVQRVTDSLEAVAREVQERVGAAPDTIPAEERQALEREYLNALTAYQTYRQDRQREAQQMQQEGFAEINQQIQPVLQTIQEERDYDLVLNARGNAVIMFSDRVNITAEVIARLEDVEDTP